MAAQNEEKNGLAGVSESEWSKIYGEKTERIQHYDGIWKGGGLGTNGRWDGVEKGENGWVAL